jgi:hypothetical protein
MHNVMGGCKVSGRRMLTAACGYGETTTACKAEQRRQISRLRSCGSDGHPCHSRL